MLKKNPFKKCNKKNLPSLSFEMALDVKLKTSKEIFNKFIIAFILLSILNFVWFLKCKQSKHCKLKI